MELSVDDNLVYEQVGSRGRRFGLPTTMKPLFRPDVLRQHVSVFELPERVERAKEKLDTWAEFFSSDASDGFKEKNLLPDFLTDIFCEVLGYTGPVEGRGRYTISREQLVEAGGKFADAVLGEFGPDERRFFVALEGKGPRNPLDRPFGGRRMSAIEQGYQYALNLPCDWIIVTSMRETRLYYKGTDQYTCERFEMERLAHDDTQLRKFVFLLDAERVVPVDGTCHLYDLLKDSETADQNLTRAYYQQYANIRHDAFLALCHANSEIPKEQILTATQKLLDRILFCAFCEDRGLIPDDTIKEAYEHRDPYNPRPTWENFRALFQFVDQGNNTLGIPQYNGGLFALDPILDNLAVPDEVCAFFKTLGDYDYRPIEYVQDALDDISVNNLVDVDILGHIFEQSITDLERLRNELEGIAEPLDPKKHKSRRKKEGAFYTPNFITRYIVEQTLGSILRERQERLRKTHAAQATGTACSVMAEPAAYDLTTLNNPQRDALVAFWLDWQQHLARVRVLDPACGSGAFLIEAYDQLFAAYQAANQRLEELRGHAELFDLSRQILERNLYGVDINEEAIEICRLSLWIKTAERAKVLTDLDHTIRIGNSVIDDPEIHPKAFNWCEAFSEVFEDGGFDVVVGNPPYVRQELLSPYKPYFEKSYRSYHGMADLYVYFYELGMRLLKPGGKLSLVVTNKWMKAGYGEPLRRFFGDHSWLESVVDFGHAKQIFEDADVFPSIIVARRPTDDPKPKDTRVCAIPREQLRVDNLSFQIAEEGFRLERAWFGSEVWQLEPKEAVELATKLVDVAVPLKDFVGASPLYGVKTGCNRAFLIDERTKDRLLGTDPASDQYIRPYFRGQDIKRWSSNWAGLWMIAIESSRDRQHPWSEAGSDAELVFCETCPGIYSHLKAFEAALRQRQDQGQHWWELRPCAYWEAFSSPKIIYPEITWQPKWCLDTSGTLVNNTVFFLPSSDLWVMAVVNSPTAWWLAWRKAVHGKDEALRFLGNFVEAFPVPDPSKETQDRALLLVSQVSESSARQLSTCRQLLDWLRVEFDIEKPGTKLQFPIGLDTDAFVNEVRRVRGKKHPLTSAALRTLREEHAATIVPAQALAAKALAIEHRISDLVNKAYDLTPEEIDIIWKTAPPRMPISQHRQAVGSSE